MFLKPRNYAKVHVNIIDLPPVHPTKVAAKNSRLVGTWWIRDLMRGYQHSYWSVMRIPDWVVRSEVTYYATIQSSRWKLSNRLTYQILWTLRYDGQNVSGLKLCQGIERVQQITVLGVVINDRLTASDHVNYLITSSARLLTNKQTNKWFIGFWQPYGWITQAYIQKLHKI